MLKAVEVTANIIYYKINDIISAKDAILEAIIDDKEISRPEVISMRYLRSHILR